MTLRVVLDATAIPGRPVGVGHYVLGLLGAMAGTEADVDLHVLAKRRDVEDLRRAAPGARIHPVSPRSRVGRLVWEQTLLPVRARRLGPAVFHGPHYTLPRWLSGPGVVTFHDPTFFTHPEVHERAKVAYFSRMARAGTHRAERVIAVSEYARHGAVRHAGAEPSRVDVVPLGVDHQRYRPDGDPEADAVLRAALGVESPYLLWIGALEPRKGVPALVQAFADLVRAGLPHRLVLAGPRAWGAAAVDEAVARSGVAGRVLFPGYVEEAQKLALYRGADALVYPSLVEGFGLPVLEAMACGCPVVTTTGSGPEEVGGDAVELVPPGDPATLREGIERVVTDRARAEELRGRGLDRAGGFGWARTAAGTVETYRRAAEAERVAG